MSATEPIAPEFEWDWEVDVLQNLNHFLGMDLKYMLGIPDLTLTGDRVLFVLKGGHKAAQEMAQELASRARVTWEKGRPTGYPHIPILENLPPEGPPPEKILLRVTDLMGDLCFWRGQREYLESEELVREEDWPVRWVLGVLFFAEKRVLVYGDFRHARVKLVFTETFFVGGDAPEGQTRRVARLLERLQGALTIKNRYSRNEAYRWAKIVNVIHGPQWLSLMDQKGNLTIEQVPYPEWS